MPLYSAQANSPQTTISANITNSATTISVVDGSVLPSAPNLLTLGFNTNAPETVLMTSKSGNTLTVTRNIEGINKAWNTGTSIARVFTAKDYNDMKTVVELTQTGLATEVITRGDADTLLQAQIDLIDAVLETHQGNMFKSIYDPNEIEADAFNMDNMVESDSKKILTSEERVLMNQSLYKISNDFAGYGTGALLPWTSSVSNNGAISINSSSANGNHFGVYQYVTGTTFGAVCMLQINFSYFKLTGKEKTTIIFKTGTVVDLVERITGFHNAGKGVYCKTVDGIIKGTTVDDNGTSETATSYLLSVSTWYRLEIKMNNDATLAIFTLYADDSDTILWTDVLSENIYKAYGVGYLDRCEYKAIGSYTRLSDVDYIDVVLPSLRKTF